MKFQFNSQIEEGRRIEAPHSDSDIKNEPMLFRSDLRFARENGGPITNLFLDNLSAKFLAANTLLIDSRAHMLMQGWYPAIPGFHHDDVPRTRADKQPNYRNPEYRAEHAMLLVNAHKAPTEFALGEASFPEIENGVVYGTWNNLVKDYLYQGRLVKYSAPNNTIIYFDWQTWHRAVPCQENGWRFFIRATINNPEPPKNEVRKQTQVYIDSLEKGW